MTIERAFTNTIIVFLALLYLDGCCGSGQLEQKDWEMKMLNAFFTVDKILNNKYPCLTKEQLVAIVGEPDLQLNPLELQEILINDNLYRKRVMDQLWKDYCRAKKEQPDFHCIPGSDRWTMCEEFKKCSLWLYDESNRFSRPIDRGIWCANTGFKAHFFFFEDSKVVGGAPVAFWEPLLSTKNNIRLRQHK